jgi:hypothetical protein
VVYAAAVRMIVADFALSVALDVAVLVTMFAARIVFRLLGLRRCWTDLSDRHRPRATGCRAEENEAHGDKPDG